MIFRRQLATAELPSSNMPVQSVPSHLVSRGWFVKQGKQTESRQDGIRIERCESARMKLSIALKCSRCSRSAMGKSGTSDGSRWPLALSHPGLAEFPTCKGSASEASGTVSDRYLLVLRARELAASC